MGQRLSLALEQLWPWVRVSVSISNCIADEAGELTASSSSVCSAFLAAASFGAAFFAGALGFGAAFCGSISKNSSTRKSELTFTAALGAAFVVFVFFAGGSSPLSSAFGSLFFTVAFSGAAALVVFAGALAFEAELLTEETFDEAFATGAFVILAFVAGAFLGAAFFVASGSTGGVNLVFLALGAGVWSWTSDAFRFVALTVVVVFVIVVETTEALLLLAARAGFADAAAAAADLGAAFVFGASIVFGASFAAFSGFAAASVAFFGGMVMILARGGSNGMGGVDGNGDGDGLMERGTGT